MRTIRTRTIACAVAMAAVLSLAPLRAQTTQTALSKEAGTLSDKFAGLARVMKENTAGGKVSTGQGKVLRVLHRQADGSWKFARVMFPRPRPFALFARL